MSRTPPARPYPRTISSPDCADPPVRPRRGKAHPHAGSTVRRLPLPASRGGGLFSSHPVCPVFVCHGKRGTIHQAYRDGTEDQLGALGLLLNAIVLWTTPYIDAAVTQLRAEGDEIRDEDITRLSPLKHRNLYLLGRYSFSAGVPAADRPAPAARPGYARARRGRGRRRRRRRIRRRGRRGLECVLTSPAAARCCPAVRRIGPGFAGSGLRAAFGAGVRAFVQRWFRRKGPLWCRTVP